MNLETEQHAASDSDVTSSSDDDVVINCMNVGQFVPAIGLQYWVLLSCLANVKFELIHMHSKDPWFIFFTAPASQILSHSFSLSNNNSKPYILSRFKKTYFALSTYTNKRIHSFRSLSYDRSVTPSKASSPHSEIQCHYAPPSGSNNWSFDWRPFHVCELLLKWKMFQIKL